MRGAAVATVHVSTAGWPMLSEMCGGAESSGGGFDHTRCARGPTRSYSCRNASFTTACVSPLAVAKCCTCGGSRSGVTVTGIGASSRSRSAATSLTPGIHGEACTRTHAPRGQRVDEREPLGRRRCTGVQSCDDVVVDRTERDLHARLAECRQEIHIAENRGALGDEREREALLDEHLERRFGDPVVRLHVRVDVGEGSHPEPCGYRRRPRRAAPVRLAVVL